MSSSASVQQVPERVWRELDIEDAPFADLVYFALSPTALETLRTFERHLIAFHPGQPRPKQGPSTVWYELDAEDLVIVDWYYTFTPSVRASVRALILLLAGGRARVTCSLARRLGTTPPSDPAVPVRSPRWPLVRGGRLDVEPSGPSPTASRPARTRAQ